MRTVLAPAILALALAAPGALAAVTYSSQQRIIAAYADAVVVWDGTLPAPTGADVRSAPDFGPFNDSAAVSVPVAGAPVPSSGFANMNCTLGPTGISLQSLCNGTDANGSGGSGTGLGVAYLRVGFSVDVPTTYDLALTFSGSSTSSFTFCQGSLKRLPSTTLASWNTFAALFSPSSGTLQPGSYELIIDLRAGHAGSGSASRSQGYMGHLNLTPATCPADYNGMNGVDLLDIFAFLTDWFAGAPRADFNGQNGVDLLDIFAFLQAWFAGC
jgi:hypothetical protein